MNYLVDLLGGLLILASGLFFVIGRQRLVWLARGGLLLGIGLIVLFTGAPGRGPASPYGAELKLRLVTGLLSFLVLVTTLEALRRTRMRERYAMLWAGTGFIIFLFALFPRSAMLWLQKLTGMQYITAVVVVVFSFLLLVSFHYSIMLSRLQNHQGRSVRRIALLEARIRKLEQAAACAGSAAPDKRTAAAATAADDRRRNRGAGTEEVGQ